MPFYGVPGTVDIPYIDLELGDCYIVWFNEENDDYHIFKCYNFEKEIKEIIEFVKNS